MFKHVIFGLVMVAAVANAATIEKRKSNHQRMTPEAQEGFHDLLDEWAGVFRISDLGQKLDPLVLKQPLVSVNSSQVIDGKLTTTELFLGDIVIKGLSTLHRTGKCAIDPLGNDPSSGALVVADIELDAGFYPVTIGATFTSKTNGVGIENLRIEMTLRNVAVYMWIRAQLSLPLSSSKLAIQELTIKDLGHLDIDIKGLGLLEVIAEPLIELVANLVKNIVGGVIAGIVRTALQNILDSIIPKPPAIAAMEKILANL